MLISSNSALRVRLPLVASKAFKIVTRSISGRLKISASAVLSAGPDTAAADGVNRSGGVAGLAVGLSAKGETAGAGLGIGAGAGESGDADGLA